VLDRHTDPAATFTAVLVTISGSLRELGKEELETIHVFVKDGDFEGAGYHLLRLGGLPGL
jgi:hypothetical protein